MTFESKSSGETEQIGFDLGKKLRRKKKFLALYGQLGSGKTTFLRGLAKGLGIKSRISSPTFTYERIHRGTTPFFHFDCYRVQRKNSILLNELTESMEQESGIIAVEWAENISHFLPGKRTEIIFKIIDQKKRKIIIKDYD